MEFKQLEMFVAVAEERSVGRAATRVFRTQAAVSMAISKLEDEAGRLLFVRSRRDPFRLTETGEALYDYARRLLELRDEASAILCAACSDSRPIAFSSARGTKPTTALRTTNSPAIRR